jgi:NAD(P)-dependent dehydrogenase (short-subunit alcohol dehydrogenase family)
MDRKICIITGANSGIGRAAARQLARAGWHVVLACRSRERSEAAFAEVEAAGGEGSARLMLADLSVQESIRSFARTFLDGYDRLDGLVHNAAEFDVSRRQPVVTADGIESVWATNHLGPVLLTELLLPAIRQSRQGRILTVSSKGLTLYPRLTVDHEDPEFRQRRYSVQRAYYQSKLAQVMYTRWLAGQLAGTGVTVNCVRVTNVKIDLRRYPHLSPVQRLAYRLKSRFSITPEEMARTYAYLLDSPEIAEVSGSCFDEDNRIVETSAPSRDKKSIEALMRLTERYLGALAESRLRKDG